LTPPIYFVSVSFGTELLKELKLKKLNVIILFLTLFFYNTNIAKSSLDKSKENVFANEISFMINKTEGEGKNNKIFVRLGSHLCSIVLDKENHKKFIEKVTLKWEQYTEEHLPFKKGKMVKNTTDEHLDADPCEQTLTRGYLTIILRILSEGGVLNGLDVPLWVFYCADILLYYCELYGL